MTVQINRTYRRFRNAGFSPVESLRNAKVVTEFESREDVRIRWHANQENYFDVYGEPDTKEDRDEICRLIDLWGCVCVYSEYQDEDGYWQQADSVGMCIYANPASPLENCYVPDLMKAALEASTVPRYSI